MTYYITLSFIKNNIHLKSEGVRKPLALQLDDHPTRPPLRPDLVFHITS